MNGPNSGDLPPVSDVPEHNDKLNIKVSGFLINCIYYFTIFFQNLIIAHGTFSF
jgi:hypothetical protein